MSQLVQQLSWLIFPLQVRDPIWALVCVRVYLSVCRLGKQWSIAQSLWDPESTWGTQKTLLGPGFSSCCCTHLGTELVDGRSLALSFSLQICLYNKNK